MTKQLYIAPRAEELPMLPEGAICVSMEIDDQINPWSVMSDPLNTIF